MFVNSLKENTFEDERGRITFRNHKFLSENPSQIFSLKEFITVQAFLSDFADICYDENSDENFQKLKSWVESTLKRRTTSKYSISQGLTAEDFSKLAKKVMKKMDRTKDIQTQRDYILTYLPFLSGVQSTITPSGMDRVLHERQVVLPFLLGTIEGKHDIFKNPTIGGPLKGKFKPPREGDFNADDQSVYVKPTAVFNEEHQSVVPDLVLQILAFANAYGLLSVEAIDEITVKYLINNVFREEGFCFLRQIPQLQVVRNFEHYYANVRLPSVIGHITPCLSTMDIYGLIQVVMTDNGDQLAANLAPYGGPTLQNVIKYFYKFADTWIPNNFLGMSYSPNEKRAFAEKIMKRFGFEVVSKNPMHSQYGVGHLHPFRFKTPNPADPTGPQLDLGWVDMRLFWIQFNYGNKPTLMMTKIQEILDIPYATPHTMPGRYGSYIQDDVRIFYNFPMKDVHNLAEYLTYLGRIQCNGEGTQYYCVDERYSRAADFKTFVERYDPFDPVTHVYIIEIPGGSLFLPAGPNFYKVFS
jgi:hypothetical protein